MSDESRLPEVKIGFFVLVALGLLIFGSLWIAGSTFFGASRVSYTVKLKDSAGIQAGDRVRFAGVGVGRIKWISLRPEDEWPVALGVALKPEVPVRTDSTARIASSGLLAQGFLQIEAGSPGSALLEPGGTILGDTAGGGIQGTISHLDDVVTKALIVMAQVSGILDEMSGQIGPLLGRVERLLSEDNIGEIEELLAMLKRTAEDAEPRLTELLQHLESIASQAETSLEGMPELTARLTALVGDVRESFGPEGERLKDVVEAAGSTMESADQILAGVAANRVELETALRDLGETMANLRAFSQQVKERPFSLVWIKAEPDRRPGQAPKRSPR